MSVTKAINASGYNVKGGAITKAGTVNFVKRHLTSSSQGTAFNPTGAILSQDRAMASFSTSGTAPAAGTVLFDHVLRGMSLGTVVLRNHGAGNIYYAFNNPTGVADTACAVLPASSVVDIQESLITQIYIKGDGATTFSCMGLAPVDRTKELE